MLMAVFVVVEGEGKESLFQKQHPGVMEGTTPSPSPFSPEIINNIIVHVSNSVA
jgi:hypothetical protein